MSVLSTDGLAARKRTMRAEVRRSRCERSDADRAAADRAMARHATELVAALGASTVALYLSTPTEPGTRGLLAALAQSDVRVLLPRPIAAGRLEWVVAGGGERITPGLGTPEPIGIALPGDPLAEVDLVFVPACAVDGRGGRLGWGGGFYDRTLDELAARTSNPMHAIPAAGDGGLEIAARHHRAPVVAIVFDDDVRDDLPLEPHDAPIDGVLTPSGLRMRGAD